MTDGAEEPVDDSPGDPSTWYPGPYGADDRLGTYNEVTAEKRAAALAMLDLTRPVATFSLGDGIWIGYPGYGTRAYEQQVVLAGFEPAHDFEGEVLDTRPQGANELCFVEERISTTYNMSTKVNGLGHAGRAGTFYNGLRGADIAHTWGLTELDVPTWGPPLCTRGLLVDVVGHVAAEGGPVVQDALGNVMLGGAHRITVEEIEGAMDRQGLPTVEPGDVVCLRTGWIARTRSDPEGFLRGSPGPFVRESRWLARFRPAILATDSWMWGVLDFEGTGRRVSEAYQLLMTQHGIRVGESVSTEALHAAGVDRFVFLHSPLQAQGAVSSSSPPMALANLPDG